LNLYQQALKNKKAKNFNPQKLTAVDLLGLELTI